MYQKYIAKLHNKMLHQNYIQIYIPKLPTKVTYQYSRLKIYMQEIMQAVFNDDLKLHF